MEDFEIDTADPIERCRRGWEAVGLDWDSGAGNQIAEPEKEPGEDSDDKDDHPPSVE